MNPPEAHLPLHQPPRPEYKNKCHIKKIKNQGSAKYDRVVFPRILLGRFGLGHENGPRENPEEVRSECLVKIPAGSGGK